MSKNAPYSAIGGIFEYLNQDCGYKNWSQYLICKLASLGIKAGARGVDLGCGNGYFTRALYKAGYGMTGVDLSPQMLSAAMDLSLKEGVKTQYILGDIATFKPNFKPDFCIAVNDCFNYIPQDRLFTVFKKIYGYLRAGGALIFDISTEYKLREIIGNNLFAEDRGDIAYMWFNSLKADRVDMDITLFKDNGKGAYERLEEAQTQYIHGANQIFEALTAAGFAAESEGHLGKDDKERVNFICIKK